MCVCVCVCVFYWSCTKSHLSDKIKRNFFQAVVVSILLNGYHMNVDETYGEKA